MANEPLPSDPDKAFTERVDLDFALQAAGLGVWELDLKDQLIRWDERCQALFGLTRSTKIHYEAAMQSVHPDDISRVRQVLRQAMQPLTGGTVDLTCRTISPTDQQLRWIRLTGRGYFAQPGQPDRVAGIAHEVTQQVEDKLRAQQTVQHLQAVLDSSPAIIAFLKPVFRQDHEVVSFVIMVCNQRLVHLSQKPMDQLLHQPFTQISHLLWAEQTFANLRQVLQTGEPFHQEQPEQTLQGERWFSLAVTKWDGGVVITGLDITPLKESQHQLHLRLTELNESKADSATLQTLLLLVQQRGELLRAASHDLRGNLNSLAGVMGLLEMTAQPHGRMPPMLDIMRRTIRQASQLLTNLLELVRLEEGHQPLQATSMDVSALLTSLLIRLRGVAGEKGLLVTADGAKPLHVESEEASLTCMVHNLLLNLIQQATEGQFHLSWAADADQQRWWCSIEHATTNQNLLPELLAKLDKTSAPLRSPDQQTTNRVSIPPLNWEEGHSEEAIGLRIVQHLVKRLRVSVRIQTEAAGSAKLILSLPMSYSEST